MLVVAASVVVGCGSDGARIADASRDVAPSTTVPAATTDTTTAAADELVRLARSVHGLTSDTEAACIASSVGAAVGPGAAEALLRDGAFEKVETAAGRAALAHAVFDCKDVRRPGFFGVAVRPTSGGVSEAQNACADRWMEDEDRIGILAMTWDSPREWRDTALYGEWLVATGECLERAQVLDTIMFTARSHDRRLDDRGVRCFAEALVATVGPGEAIRIEGRYTPRSADRRVIADAVAACVS